MNGAKFASNTILFRRHKTKECNVFIRTNESARFWQATAAGDDVNTPGRRSRLPWLQKLGKNSWKMQTETVHSCFEKVKICSTCVYKYARASKNEHTRKKDEDSSL